MKVTRTVVPREHISGANVIISHCSQEGPDDFQEATVTMEPYWNSAELHIGHENLGIPDFAIPEVIYLLRAYQKDIAAARKRSDEKAKEKKK